MNRRNIIGIALGAIFTAAAGYWFTFGRRPLLDVELDQELGVEAPEVTA